MHWGRRIQRALWEGQQGPTIFLFTAYLLGISVNLVSDVAGQLRGIAWWTIFILGPALFLFVSSGLWLRLFTGRVETSVSTQAAEPRKGLVVFASPGDGIQTARKAIEHHLPVLEKVWLVYSKGGPVSSEAAALDLKRDVVTSNLLRPDQIQELPMVVDAFEDPEQVKELVENEVYGRLPDGLTDNDVIIDITGGRKTTTAGAFLAGLPKGRRLEINAPAAMNIRGLGTRPGTPLEIFVDYKLRRVRRP
jgi:hypothetical protein